MMHTGVGPRDFTYSIIEKRNMLELNVDRPRPLIDINLMHKKCKSRVDSSFTDYLLRDCDLKGSTVSSVASISLLLFVHDYIEKGNKHNFCFLDNETEMLYKDLKGGL